MDSMVKVVYNMLYVKYDTNGRVALKKEQDQWIIDKDKYFIEVAHDDLADDANESRFLRLPDLPHLSEKDKGITQQAYLLEFSILYLIKVFVTKITFIPDQLHDSFIVLVFTLYRQIMINVLLIFKKPNPVRLANGTKR
jgi:hypothetical protein